MLADTQVLPQPCHTRVDHGRAAIRRDRVGETLLDAKHVAEIRVGGRKVGLALRRGRKAFRRGVEFSLRLQGEAQVVEQHCMLRARRERGAISDDGLGMVAASAMIIADPEMRLGVIRRERNRTLPSGKRRLGIDRFEAQPQDRPGSAVVRVELHRTPRARECEFALPAR
jgi:hypothetical protein